MLRKILAKDEIIKVHPSFFEETRVSLKLPTLEKKWSRLEADIQKILEIVQEGSHNLKSEDSKKLEVHFKNFSSDGTFYFETNVKLDWKENKEIVLYKKQKTGIVELVFELLCVEQNLIACKPKSLRSSQEERKHERIINKEKSIYSENFEIVDTHSDLTTYLNFEISQLFQEIERDYRITHPNLELHYLYNASELISIEKSLAMKKKPVFSMLNKDLESYPGDFSSFEDSYSSSITVQDKLQVLKEQNISSFAIYPIFFRFQNKQIFIGCGYLWEFQPKKLPTSDIFLFEEIENRINSKILEKSSIKIIPESQEVVNFSKGGMLFKTSNSEIIQSILIKPKFSAIICNHLEKIKLQFYAKNIYQIEKDYYIGAEILGNSNSDAKIQNYFKWIEERNK